MKKAIALLAIAVLGGVIAFFAMRTTKAAAHGGVLLDTMPELAWVRTELKLSDAQFEKVSALHAAYRPKCVAMCAEIAAAHEKIEAAAKGVDGMTPSLEAALREHAEIHVRCQMAMMQHMYETAAVLDKEQSARYLNTMLPFALDFSHSESGNIHQR